ncbi:hypothetical protein Leryth_010541 [Lithospermum erythrorhizon]|nr:hypothetical protein Leryth_010541 [Lithospermum erythrorhizon]
MNKPHKTNYRSRLDNNVERSWSGNSATRPSKQPTSCALEASKSNIGSNLPPPHGHPQLYHSGPVKSEPRSPRLVRSGGMRRDWSFEHLS